MADRAGPGGDPGRPWRRFTFHVDFMAPDEERARHQAEAYAQGLIHLRDEVDCYTARVSVDGDWLRAAPVFCGAPGPDGTDVCVDGAGHSGWHHGPGVSRRWSDDDVPAAPATLHDLP